MKKNKFLKILTATLALSCSIGFSAPNNIAEASNVEILSFDGGDITKSFSNEMLYNAGYMSQYMLFDKQKGTYPVLTGMEFAERVKSGGVWDFKRTYTKYYTFDGMFISGEYIGNMHYGFVGRGAGFSRNLLSSAAGAYQIYSGTSSIKWYKSYFDDPSDQAAITKGMNYFRDGLPKTTSSKSLTLSDVSDSEFTETVLKSLSENDKLKIKAEFDKDFAEYTKQQNQN